MKSVLVVAASLFIAATPALAQQVTAPDLGEILVTSNRQNVRYAQQERPVVGLRRQADSAVMQMSISSESRDAAVRKREIHSMLASALDRAAAAQIELVTGPYELTPVTKATYQELPQYNGGRADTSQVSLMIKTKLAGSAVAAQQRLEAFVKSLPRSDRGAVDHGSGITLTIINPDQYREAIIKAVAEHARRHASFFGDNYAVRVDGIDGQVLWSQVTSTDVFLYIPYRFAVVPK
jgi:hypothetical protein